MEHPESQTAGYVSAEFRLQNPGIFFKFKLRHHQDEPLCAVVAKNSMAMESLKTGDMISMIYHFQDRTIPAQHHPTRIKTILDGSGMGFQDHFIISLDIQQQVLIKDLIS